MYRINEKLWGKLMMSMNLMIAIKVELVAISLFALTLGIQQNMKYIIILDISTISLFREKSLAVKHSIGHR